ncbi:ferritin-like domain-containing protein [Mycobacteroides stephanolepidis]|uniref:ferritin-like domain-containing protein n=1 Tax=[Mycobacterium] stephanolepidis TaxID=1520670 RepID=UPI001300A2D3|nr:ferritin-like domain-containing protein [[Mycobacterium] stephanolepidis]
MTRLPTGPRSGLLDLATNQPLTVDGPFPLERAAREYDELLEAAGSRFDQSGVLKAGGPFHTVKGWNFGGNGHFWIDAKVVSCERMAGVVDTDDSLVGRDVDFWGHYCEYTASTANRARVFDVDPSSNWTTTLMIGQLALGRLGRSHDVGYLLTGDVNGYCPPRWQNSRHFDQVGGHPLAQWLRRSTLFQFAIGRDEGLQWLEGAGASPALAALRESIDSEAADGLVVQFALTGMAAPVAADAPDRWGLRGTIGPWRAAELRTYPAGRLLAPRSTDAVGEDALPHMASVRVADSEVTMNLVTAIPAVRRGTRDDHTPVTYVDELIDMGDLELQTTEGEVIAVVPRNAYLDKNYHLTSGILTVPRLDESQENPDAALRLIGAGRVLLEETETVVQSDEASLFLEHPNSRTGEDFAVDVSVRSYFRGEPAAAQAIDVRQFFNPRALPLDSTAQAPGARPEDVMIVAVRGSAAAGYTTNATLSTDAHGFGFVTVKGIRAGTTRILLQPEGSLPPEAENACAAYDNDDLLGYWSTVGSISIRVLPDRWYLDDVHDNAITFDLLYREVFAYYELLYSFMRTDVLSLADEFKVEPYARLIWHVSGPEHRGRTYFMPSTRDVSMPQIRLLQRYFLACEARRQVPPIPTRRPLPIEAITTRSELHAALDQVLSIELAVMTQYLYAAYSIPTQDAAKHYVKEGIWSEEQSVLACGSGPGTLNNGYRGLLMNVAREEMIHFLAINNIRMAVGLPFQVPRLDFGRLNGRLWTPLELSLEPFGLAAVERFVELERPHELVPGLLGDRPTPQRPYRYGSLSELYAAIRDGIQRIPDVLVAKKYQGGGGHHLFMRESVNAIHPDYQLEVDDVASAIFAIDFVTEHGEGGKIALPNTGEESHFETFLGISASLVEERVNTSLGERIPWNPAYPVLRNPTLHTADAARCHVTNAPARDAMTVFNRSYQLAAQLMVQHFGYCPAANLRRSPLMNWALDIMVTVLRPLGELIVTLLSGLAGKTAGPSFELESDPRYVPRPEVAMACMAREADEIATLARRCPGLAVAVPDVLTFLGEQFRAFARDRH